MINQKYICAILLGILLCFTYYGHAHSFGSDLRRRSIGRLGFTNNVTMATPKYGGNSTASVFNVRDYGAKGDGIEDDTKAFEAAWAATCKVDHGVMLVPSQFTFLLQPITFGGIGCLSNLTVQLDGEIVAPPVASDWKNVYDQWILFTGLSNGLKISGKGVINGHGENWWKNAQIIHDSFDENGLTNTKKRPYAIRILNSKNVVVTGITIKNSPLMHIFFDTCQYVTVFDFTVSSPENSPNTDGIHLSRTKNVDIHNSTIACGDDCISIQTGSSNVTIYDVHCGPGHGYSIGSLGFMLTEAYVSNIGVYNSSATGTSNGVRIKTWEGATGSAQNITFENIVMSNVQNSIVIDQYYCNGSDFCNATSDKNAVAISGVTYKNITGTYTKRSVVFVCSEDKPCRDVDVSTINLNPSRGNSMVLKGQSLYCSHAYGKVLTDTTPSLQNCLLSDQDETPSPAKKVEEYKYDASCKYSREQNCYPRNKTVTRETHEKERYR